MAKHRAEYLSSQIEDRAFKLHERSLLVGGLGGIAIGATGSLLHNPAIQTLGALMAVTSLGVAFYATTRMDEAAERQLSNTVQPPEFEFPD